MAEPPGPKISISAPVFRPVEWRNARTTVTLMVGLLVAMLAGLKQESPDEIRVLVVVPVARLDRAALRALAYATSLRHPVLAVHISPGQEEAERFRGHWNTWGDHIPLEIIISPYRAVIAPLAHYLCALSAQRPDIIATVVLPETVVTRSWHGILHSRTAERLRRQLRRFPGIVIVSVPIHVP
jgi:hypothetical protein